MTGPLVTLLFRQASRIKRQTAIIAEQERIIDGLTARLRRIQSDVELLGACIPHDKRDVALGLVRDRHRIEDLDQIEEVGG